MWASKVTRLSFSVQQWWIIVTGAGMGMMLGPSNTDAINRASTLSYGEATGITQTIRNLGASLGLAVLGTILLTVQRSKLTVSFVARHVPNAAVVAAHTAQSQGGTSTSHIPQFFRLDFADAIQVVLYVMCGIMGLAAVVAFVGLRRGRQDLPDDAPVPDVGAPVAS
jgi:hypothetical protein